MFRDNVLFPLFFVCSCFLVHTAALCDLNNPIEVSIFGNAAASYRPIACPNNYTLSGGISDPGFTGAGSWGNRCPGPCVGSWTYNAEFSSFSSINPSAIWQRPGGGPINSNFVPVAGGIYAITLCARATNPSTFRNLFIGLDEYDSVGMTFFDTAVLTVNLTDTFQTYRACFTGGNSWSTQRSFFWASGNQTNDAGVVPVGPTADFTMGYLNIQTVQFVTTAQQSTALQSTNEQTTAQISTAIQTTAQQTTAQQTTVQQTTAQQTTVQQTTAQLQVTTAFQTTSQQTTAIFVDPVIANDVSTGIGIALMVVIVVIYVCCFAVGCLPVFLVLLPKKRANSSA